MTTSSPEKFLRIADPGHSWLSVPRAHLESLGIADQISGCSYQRGGQVYLEEDCDMWVFLDAMTAAGRVVAVDERYHDRTPLRSYERYEEA